MWLVEWQAWKTVCSAGYSADIDNWFDGTGDTDQTLGIREWIAEHEDGLTDEQCALLVSIDRKVVSLAGRFPVVGSFDVMMLKKIAALSANGGVRRAA